MSEAFAYLLPGMMYFWVLFIGQGPMQEILFEKESFTLARILASPASATDFIISKMARCFLLSVFVQSGMLLLSAFLFGIHWGNPFYLALVILAGAASMTGLLAIIYSLARTKEQANSLSSITFIICGMLGGGMFPYDQMPKFLQSVGQFSPVRWGVLALQSVTQSKPIAEVLSKSGILLIFGLVGSLAAFHLFCRQITQGTEK